MNAGKHVSSKTTKQTKLVSVIQQTKNIHDTDHADDEEEESIHDETDPVSREKSLATFLRETNMELEELKNSSLLICENETTSDNSNIPSTQEMRSRKLSLTSKCKTVKFGWKNSENSLIL